MYVDCWETLHPARFCLRALSSDEFGLLDLYNLDQAAATRIIQDAWDCVIPSALAQIFRRSGVISSRSGVNGSPNAGWVIRSNKSSDLDD